MRITSPTTRRTAAVLAASTAVLGLAACSPPGGSTAGDSSALTVTIWGSDIDKEVFEQRLALAEKALPDIEVDLVQISKDYDTKLQTMIAGGDAPDVMMIAEGVNVLSSKGQLEDLGPYLADDDVDPVERFGQGVVDTYSTDGKLWAMPDRSSAMALYYNKALFDAAGVDYPDGSWDWEQFRDAADRLTVREGDDVTSYGYAAGDWWPWYMTWIFQNGGMVLDDEGKPVVDSPENVEALQFYNDMVFEDRSAPSPADYANEGLDNGQPDPLFAQGKLAMVSTGFWNVATLSDTDLDWGVAPLWHGADEAVPAFGSALAVSSKSEHKDAAAKLVEFLTSEEGQEPLAASGLDVPANIDSQESDAFLNPEWNTAGVDLSAFTDSTESIFSPPLVPEWNEIQKAFTDGLAATWTGDQSVEDGLTAVQAELERVLK